MTQNPTVTVATLLQVMLPMQHAGIPVEDSCAFIGLKSAHLNNLEARYPVSLVATLLTKAVQRSGDEYFWLKAAHPELVSTNNLFFYIIFQAKTLADFILRAERMYKYFTDELSPSHHVKGNQYFYTANFRLPEAEVSVYRVDFWISITLLYASLFAGEKHQIIEIHLSAPFNHRREVYEEYFQTPVRINQARVALCAPCSNLELTNIRNPQDPHLEQLLMRQLDAKLISDFSTTTFLLNVQEVLRKQLPNGTPGIEMVAEQLVMSSRSLQRKLAEEETTFHEQLRLVRSELAMQYLDQPEMSISQIAYLLGFQDNRSLTVAFRKWFDMTPSEYRRQHQVRFGQAQD